jgi:tetratricopeptide (TPR) repeat protein
MTSLGSAIADLLAGRVSPREARLRAAKVPSLDDLDAWMSDLGDLCSAVLDAQDATRAGDLADVTRAALDLLVDRQASATILMSIALHLSDLQNWEAALPCFAAVSARAGESDKAIKDLALRFQFEALQRLGRDDEALDLAPEVIARAIESGRPELQVSVLASQARLLCRGGDLAAAVRAQRAAVELRRAVPEDGAGGIPSVSRLLIHLGDYARLDGHLEEAISAFEQARAAALGTAGAHDAALALSELGYTYRNAGEMERGIRLLKTAAAEARQLGDLDLAARWDGQFGGVELPETSAATRVQHAASLVETDPAEAITLARECVKIATRESNAAMEAAARSNLGLALGKLGRTHQARLAYRAALAAAVRSGDLMIQFLVLANLSDELVQQPRKAEFDQVSAEAVRVGEQVRRTTGTGETKQMVAAALARVYDRMAVMSALTVTPPEGPSAIPPDAARVLDTSQRMRGRNLLRWLSMRPHLDTADPATRRAILALRAADITLEATAGEPNAVLGDLILQRSQAEAALRSHGHDEVLALAVGSDPIVFSPDELAAALRPGELLVDVMSLVDLYLVNCVTPDGKATTSAFNSKQEERRATLVRLRAAREKLRIADYQGEGIAAAEAEYTAAVAPVDEIVADVAAQIAELRPVDRIFISPQMELFALPWWKLTERLGDIEIGIVPVPGALPLLRARPLSPAPLARLRFIPDATGTLRNTNADVAHVPHESCDGDVSAILHALPGASALHFGGHGHFDPVNAYFSGFVVRQSAEPDPLSRTDPARTPRPGIALLTAAQLVARVDLPGCDLAVLAACSTGIPRQHAANEFTSVPSALLLAGARAVVASLWDTSDPAAALIMQEFYAGVTAGRSPASALAEARRTLRALDRGDVIARLGTDQYIPAADQPFARAIYTDPFQYYGTE